MRKQIETESSISLLSVFLLIGVAIHYQVGFGNELLLYIGFVVVLLLSVILLK